MSNFHEMPPLPPLGATAATASFKEMIPTSVASLPANISKEIALLSRQERWSELLAFVLAAPEVALVSMTMDNNIATTLMHQAITSKSDVKSRADLIKAILSSKPEAASITNGYGSLPLHVIAQRNCKIDSASKEELVAALLQAYPHALITEGGVGRRTPLHIAFTDYISPRLAKLMIDAGPAATKVKDKKGWLPIHVACSRHCSPEKLRMLLEANPASLRAITNDGKTPLALANSTATKSHPNYALIKALEEMVTKERKGEYSIHMQQTMPSCAAFSGMTPFECQDMPPLPLVVQNGAVAAVVTPSRTPNKKRKRRKEDIKRSGTIPGDISPRADKRLTRRAKRASETTTAAAQLLMNLHAGPNIRSNGFSFV